VTVGTKDLHVRIVAAWPPGRADGGRGYLLTSFSDSKHNSKLQRDTFMTQG
jgi:hypothetical protein